MSMKAICQAAWLLTVAMGNLFVLIIAEASVFGDQVHHYEHTYVRMCTLIIVSIIVLHFESSCTYIHKVNIVCMWSM